MPAFLLPPQLPPELHPLLLIESTFLPAFEK
jgi:hypothetical protein